MNVETVNVVYAKLENKPGTLERATKAVAERRLNIDGVSLETQGHQGFLRFVTPRPKEAVESLRSHGIEAYESESVLVSLANRPGELAKACAEIAAARVNIEGVVTTADGRVAIRSSDNERAAQILRKL